MRKKLRVLSVLMALCCTVLLVAGCGGPGSTAPDSTPSAPGGSDSGGAQEQVTLEFAYWAGAGPEEEAYNTLIQQYMDENPHVKIEAQMLTYADYYTALDTRIGGGQAPDVCKMLYQQAGTYLDAGVLGDMSPYIPQEELDDLMPAFKSAATTEDGKVIAFPLQTDTYLLFYNKEMFANADIEVPTTMEDAWSWEEFNDVAERVQAANDVKYAFVYRWTKTKSYSLFPWIYANGGSVVNSDYTAGNLSGEKSMEVLEMIDMWIDTGLCAPNSPESSDNVDEIFTTGNAAMIISGNWMMSSYEESLPGNWGVTYMPQRDGKIGSDLGGAELCITSSTEHPEEAAKFVQFMTSAENSRMFCESANFLPVRQSLADAGMNYASYGEEMNYFVQQVATMDPDMVACQTDKNFPQVSKLFSQAIERIVLEDTPVAEIAADFDQAVADAVQ